MIPEEVTEIASLLRDYYDAPSNADDFDYSVDVAWEIYNKFNKR